MKFDLLVIQNHQNSGAYPFTLLFRSVDNAQIFIDALVDA